MRKVLLILFLFTTFLGESKAQYYNKRIVKDAWATTYNSCALIGDTLFVSGIYGWKNAIQNQKPLFAVYGLDGTLLKQFVFIGDTLRDYCPLQSLILSKTNDLIAVGCGGEGGTSKYGVICSSKIDFENYEIEKYTDTNRFSFPFYKLIQLSDSSFIVTGFSAAKNNSFGKTVLIKFSKNWNIIWLKYYGNSNYPYPYSLYERGDGRIMLITERTAYIPNENFPTQISIWQVIYEIDNTGNIILIKQSSSDSIFASVCVIPTSDKGFITGNAKVDSLSGQNLMHHGYVAKIDSNYNLIWDKKIVSSYGASHFNNIKKLNDGNYLAVGECINVDYSLSNSDPLQFIYAGWLVKFNEAGDILWDRKYYGVASYQEFNRLFDFAELPNGDIIACGESTNMYNDDNYTQDSILQMGWLLRIGPDGCLSGTNCGYTSIAVPQENKTIELSIYPNPAVDKINIETNALDDTENYSFVVTDLTGKAITNPVRLFQHSSYIVNAANYSSGSYIVSVFHHQQLLFSKKIEKL